MFRFGLKREEKEILIRTINELQELRAELSSFKNTLAGILPADGGTGAETGAGSGGGEVAGPTGTGEEPGGNQGTQGQGLDVQPAPESTGPDLAEEGLSGNGGTGRKEAPAPKGTVPESGLGDVRAAGAAGKGGAEGPLSGVPQSAQDEPPARRDWAVVSLTQKKRPWWKLWEPEKRVTKRSV